MKDKRINEEKCAGIKRYRAVSFYVKSGSAGFGSFVLFLILRLSFSQST